MPEELRGTYAGLAHPAALEHLLSLGVSAVELLPVHQSITEPPLLSRGVEQAPRGRRDRRVQVPGNLLADEGGLPRVQAGQGLVPVFLPGVDAGQQIQAVYRIRITCQSLSTCSRPVSREPIDTRTIHCPSRIAGVR